MLTMDNIRTVAVFGDWHGNPTWGPAMLRAVAESDGPELFLHVGDFGVWPEDNPESYGKNYLQLLEAVLADLGVELWFIDGNHEHFPYLYSFPLDERGLRQLTPHVFHMPRGFTWELSGKRFVALGGAYSVDRAHRTEGETWFPEEELTASDVELALAAGSADVLITHEAPRLPKEQSGKVDATSAQQRDFVAQAMTGLDAKYLVHGHHHTAYMDDLFTTTLIGLSCDNRSQDANYVIFDVDAI